MDLRRFYPLTTDLYDEVDEEMRAETNNWRKLWSERIKQKASSVPNAII